LQIAAEVIKILAKSNFAESLPARPLQNFDWLFFNFCSSAEVIEIRTCRGHPGISLLPMAMLNKAATTCILGYGTYSFSQSTSNAVNIADKVGSNAVNVIEKGVNVLSLRKLGLTLSMPLTKLGPTL
jgi:hypothetical protein